jgi:hypothetical protein
MYKNEFNNNFNCTKINTNLQIFLDEAIKVFLDKFDNYPLSPEFIGLIKKNNAIFSEKPLYPDLVLKNKVFNKNKCFYSANQNENNYFPRDNFVIDKKKLSNTSSISNNNASNQLVNSNDLQNLAFNFNLEMAKGGKNDIINKEKENHIFNLIKSNSIWIIEINGVITKFNSLQLFEFMTINILGKNKKLDDYIVNNYDSFRNFEGGYLYICLKKYLSSIFSSQSNINNNIINSNDYNYNNYKSNQFNSNNNTNYDHNNIYSIKNFISHENENFNFGFNNP